MAWREQSLRCTTDELLEFRREWEAVRGDTGREGAAVRLFQFESEWVGYCISCAKPIPRLKSYCPNCKRSSF